MPTSQFHITLFIRLVMDTHLNLDSTIVKMMMHGETIMASFSPIGHLIMS